MNNEINVNNNFIRKSIIYFIFLIGIFIVYYSFFLPLWYYEQPNPKNLSLFSNSPTGYEYVRNIEPDKLDHKILFHYIWLYPFTAGILIVIAFSVVAYDNIKNKIMSLILNVNDIKKYIIYSSILSLPMFIVLFSTYWHYLLFNTDATHDLTAHLGSFSSILLIIFLYLLSCSINFLFLRYNLFKDKIKLLLKSILFIIKTSLMIFLYWGFVLNLLMIISYLLGNSTDPLFNTIPIFALLLLIASYYNYKKKEYKDKYNLKLLFSIIYTTIFILSYSMLFIIKMYREPEFFNKAPISFGSGFYCAIIGFGIVFVSSIIMFFITKNENIPKK